jgi:hypothetical protein
VWASYRVDAPALGSVVEALRSRLARGVASDTPAFLSASGRLALGRRDTAGAIAALRAIRSVATPADLLWEYPAAYAEERVLLARLLLARGEPAAAIVVAEVLDHGWPVAFTAYVPASLTVRAQAARALGSSRDAAAYAARLASARREGTGSH